jgi:flagellar biosynthesis chaperone FliJ
VSGMFEVPGDRLVEMHEAELKLEQIEKAYDEYEDALAQRRNGGVAADRFVKLVGALVRG